MFLFLHANPVTIPLPNSVPSLWKSTRITKALAYLQDHKCSIVVQDQFVHSNPTFKTGSNSSISSTKYPLSQYLDSFGLSPSYAHFCSLITAILEPKFYNEAVKDPK